MNPERQKPTQNSFPTNPTPITSTAQLFSHITSKGNPDIQLTELEIIRDLIFVFQGIDGQYLGYSQQEDRYVVNQDLKQPVVDLVERMAELGWFYRQV
jgi:gamma-tubulin complex component 3